MASPAFVSVGTGLQTGNPGTVALTSTIGAHTNTELHEIMVKWVQAHLQMACVLLLVMRAKPELEQVIHVYGV